MTDVKRTKPLVTPPKTKPSTAQRVLEVERGNGRRFRITIPKSYKITFAPANMAAASAKYPNDTSGMALRIYDGTSQVALFRNVNSFYDTALPIVNEVVSVFDEALLVDDGVTAKRSGRSEVTRAWT